MYASCGCKDSELQLGPRDEFDVVAFSCSFEMDYLNVLKLLELAGLPLLAAERDERYPLVIMGGPAPWGVPLWGAPPSS